MCKVLMKGDEDGSEDITIHSVQPYTIDLQNQNQQQRFSTP